MSYQQDRPNPSFNTIIRTIINTYITPLRNTGNVIDIGYALEQAHWKYEDDYVDNYMHIHKMTFKKFVNMIFSKCGWLKKRFSRSQRIIQSYYQHKKRIPVCGCILLNSKMTKVLLVTDFKNKNHTFPRGKINAGEQPFDCAIREVDEEIGNDVTRYANSDDYFVISSGGRNVTMFICANVPETLDCKPRTKKEIQDIKWVDISNLTLIRTYDVEPFIEPLLAWIQRRTKQLVNSSSISFQEDVFS